LGVINDGPKKKEGAVLWSHSSRQKIRNFQQQIHDIPALALAGKYHRIDTPFLI